MVIRLVFMTIFGKPSAAVVTAERSLGDDGHGHPGRRPVAELPAPVPSPALGAAARQDCARVFLPRVDRDHATQPRYRNGDLESANVPFPSMP